jgi:phosphatidate cytidylyltransferase
MIWKIYGIILTYFLIGGIAFFLINRKKSPGESHKNWTKYIVYFFIIHILFLSIVFFPDTFRGIVFLIIIAGLFEMMKILVQSNYRQKLFFVNSCIIYLSLSVGFYLYSGLEKNLILFTFLVVSIFDSFSQISGQIWGKIKLFPKVSPQKTMEGFVIGALAALISSFMLIRLAGLSFLQLLILAAGIILFSFTGDLLASFFKRNYHVKDFSDLIPGHGGFLDRFDSLIAGGAFVAFHEWVIKIQ